MPFQNLAAKLIFETISLSLDIKYFFAALLLVSSVISNASCSCIYFRRSDIKFPPGTYPAFSVPGAGGAPPAGAPLASDPASAFSLSAEPKPLTSSNESCNSIV